MGIVVLIFLVSAIFSGVLTFMVMKSAPFNLPWILNMPGVFAIGSFVLTFTGWLVSLFDLFDNKPGSFDVPWYAWVAYLICGILWYATIISVRKRWAAMQAAERKGAVLPETIKLYLKNAKNR